MQIARRLQRSGDGTASEASDTGAGDRRWLYGKPFIVAWLFGRVIRRRRALAGLAVLLGLVVIGSLMLLWTTPHAASTVARDSRLPPDGVGVVLPPRGTPPVMALGMSAGTSDLLSMQIASTLRTARLRLLRFGDIHADDYDWMSGCLYGSSGATRECSGPAGQGGKLDQFLLFAGAVGARPLIVVNGEINDPPRAAALVLYYQTHCARYWHGPCPQPLWEIGNAPANWKHFAVPLAQRQASDAQLIQPDQYAALVVTYAAAMRHYDPAIRIVADAWITGALDQSWINDVTAIDTHYAPLLYTSAGPPPTTASILTSLAPSDTGGPGIDAWLQNLRQSLAQLGFGKGIIMGQWSIDSNVSASEPSVYGGYVQGLFAAVMIAHLWQDAHTAGPNPLLAAVQAPLTGGAQEPFDIATGRSRAAARVYLLLSRHAGDRPITAHVGIAALRAGIVAAATVDGHGAVSLLLVNTAPSAAYTVRLRDLPGRLREGWRIGPDTAQPAGVSVEQHLQVAGDTLRLTPWSITVVRAES